MLRVRTDAILYPALPVIIHLFKLILKFIVYTGKINIISGVSCSFEVCLETRLEPLDIMIEEPILVK